MLGRWGREMVMVAEGSRFGQDLPMAVQQVGIGGGFRVKVLGGDWRSMDLEG